MQLVLAGIFVLALVTLVAGPALARLNASSSAQPTIVAAVDAFDKNAYKLDSWIKGEVHIKSLPDKIADKWKVSSVKCSDVTVVAMADGKVVSTAAAMSDPMDPAACVYSLKVPSSISLSIFAQLGNAQSVGVSSNREGTGPDKVVKSDLVTAKIAPAGSLKGSPQSLKANGGVATNSLPLYIKIDN